MLSARQAARRRAHSPGVLSGCRKRRESPSGSTGFRSLTLPGPA